RIADLKAGHSPSGLDFTPDGRLLLSADRESDQVSVFDAATGERRAVVKVGARPFGLTIDPDGRLAVTANVGSDDVSVVDIKSGREIARPKVGKRPYAATFARGRLFVTDQYGGTVTVLDGQ